MSLNSVKGKDQSIQNKLTGNSFQPLACLANSGRVRLKSARGGERLKCYGAFSVAMARCATSSIRINQNCSCLSIAMYRETFPMAPDQLIEALFPNCRLESQGEKA